jgi:hypothetical protein
VAQLDPVNIFKRLSSDIPADLRESFVIVGSLAAAYEFRRSLQGRAVNTKDADIVVYPAGNVESAQSMACALLGHGWRRTDNCRPKPAPDPTDELWAIRLMPANSSDYFVELLNVPSEGQTRPKQWIPMQLPDGWYGLPSFKFMGLTLHDKRTSAEGLSYASPAMMALGNLLSHRRITTAEKIQSGTFRGLRRCSKDLGRVLTLAWLAEDSVTAQWGDQWNDAIRACFPETWLDHSRRAGAGLRELLKDDELMEEAAKTTEIGLLSGKNIDVTALRAVGRRLLADVIKGFENQHE